MKILITGGAGTLGVNIAQYYADKGMQVAILDNFSTSTPARLADVQNIEIFEGSVADELFLKSALTSSNQIWLSIALLAMLT